MRQNFTLQKAKALERTVIKMGAHAWAMATE